MCRMTGDQISDLLKIALGIVAVCSGFLVASLNDKWNRKRDRK